MEDRNNMDRLGIDDAEPVHTLPVSSHYNTEVIDLPSKGIYYTHESLKTGKIEIYLMVASHEDIMSNKSYFTSGVILEKLLKSLIVDETIQVNDLLSVDVAYIIMSARKSAYGSKFRYSLKCPVCGSSHEPYVDMDEDLKILSKSDKYDSAVNEDGSITINLPKSKDTVTCKLHDKSIESQLIKILSDKNSSTAIKSNNNQLDLFIPNKEYLPVIIKDFNGEADRDKIIEKVGNMQALDIRYLKAAYKDASVRLEMKKEVVCQCGWSDDVEVGIMTPDFFWPEL